MGGVIRLRLADGADNAIPAQRAWRPLRSFHGRYRIMVTGPDGRVHSVDAHLSESGDNRFAVKL